MIRVQKASALPRWGDADLSQADETLSLTAGCGQGMLNVKIILFGPSS